MRTIPLTQGKITLVDDADFDWLSRWKWCAVKARNTYYAVRMTRKNGKQTTIYMHRSILKPPMGMETDHRDGNGLNNQYENLRTATRSQNARNQRKQKGTISQYKGIWWYRRDAKWQAEIWVNNRCIYLGRFLSEVEAAKAYDRAAKKYFGEFACLNFPKENDNA